MEKEEFKWNSRLVGYVKKIENNSLSMEDIDDMLFDLIGLNNSKKYMDVEGNRKCLIEKIKSSNYAVDILTERFGYNPNMVYVGDLKADDIHSSVFPYEIVFGNIDFSNYMTTDDGIHFSSTRNSSNKNMDHLKIAIGSVNLSNSKDFNIQNLKFVLGDFIIDGKHDDFNVKVIGGNAIFNGFTSKNASSLIYVGGDLDTSGSCIENMSSLKEVKGSIKKMSKNIEGLPNLESVGGDLCLDGVNFNKMPKLNSVKGNVKMGNCNNLLKAYMKMKFKKTESGYVKRININR